MKKLSIEQMEVFSGGDVAGCIGGVIGTITGVIGIAALIAFPPASLALGMGLALAGGLGTGASLGGAYTSC